MKNEGENEVFQTFHYVPRDPQVILHHICRDKLSLDSPFNKFLQRIWFSFFWSHSLSIGKTEYKVHRLSNILFSMNAISGKGKYHELLTCMAKYCSAWLRGAVIKNKKEIIWEKFPNSGGGGLRKSRGGSQFFSKCLNFKVWLLLKGLYGPILGVENQIVWIWSEGRGGQQFLKDVQN